MQLDSFGLWMVDRNVEHVATDGIGNVIGNLLNNGYPTVAAMVVETIYGTREVSLETRANGANHR